MNVQGVTTQQKSVAVAVFELTNVLGDPPTMAQVGEVRTFHDSWKDGRMVPKRRGHSLGPDAVRSVLRALESRGVLKRMPRVGRARPWKVADEARATVLAWASELPEAVTA